MNTSDPAVAPDPRPTSCVIVGGGPAGMMLGLLLARKGSPVTVLESHHDFDRDFRGDTIHPSTLETLDRIGLADRLLELPHGKLESMRFQAGGEITTVADFRRLKTRFPYIAVMPQSRFLGFLADEARKFPGFRIEFGATVQQLIIEEGVVRGVRSRGADNTSRETRATLTVGADGRFSKIRALAGFEPVKSAPPMDVLWFRLPKRPEDEADRGMFFVGNGLFIFLLDRGDEWQVGYALLKGKFAETKAAGIEVVRANLARVVPWTADRVERLREWNQVAVLSVESSRLPMWHRPGLLLIGDAAHVMSPVGGVGINYAVQDAVEAAGLLATPLRQGQAPESLLAEVRRRREPSVKAIQAFQRLVQDRVVKSALEKSRPFRLPWPVRVLLKVPIVRDLPARLIAFGFRRPIVDLSSE